MASLPFMISILAFFAQIYIFCPTFGQNRLLYQDYCVSLQKNYLITTIDVMNKLVCVIFLLLTLSINANAKGDWWLEAEDPASTSAS